ncbi:MAG: preprotein translocase subunit YajC [Candidatus Babeliales bacterium]|jgi:preprotein translocase YajC subunit
MDLLLIIPTLTLVIMCGALILLPQRWYRQECTKRNARIRQGARVTTINGITGIVVAQNDNIIILTRDDGSKVQIFMHTITTISS